MNILPVLYTKPVNINQNTPVKYNAYNFHTKSLARDIVSFGHNHVNKTAVNTGIDFLLKGIRKNIKKDLEPMSRIFLFVTKGIAEKLSSFGVEFNERYAWANPLKSAESTAEKMSRYGSFSIPDRIRTTLFSKNFYDLSILFDKVIPEYEKCNYILDDLEICMENMSEKIKDIPEKYKNHIYTEPRNSGIEQIQFRLVQKDDMKAVKHEVIILPGYEYAKAKHYESKYIYSYTRKLGELDFIKKGAEKDIDAKMAKSHADAIKLILNSSFSKRLFMDAKNKDLLGTYNNTVNMADYDANLTKSYFRSIKDRMNKYYDNAKKRATTRAGKAKIEKLREDDANLLMQIKHNILGSEKLGIEGAIDFFNRGGHTKEDPFIKKSC